MSSGMFRGKESSSRIELSRLVQDLLNFGVLGSLRLWGWWGGVPTHMCTCMGMHTCTHAHGKHDNFMQMATPIGGIPGNSLLCHTRMHVCGGTLSPPPTHIQPPTSTHPPTPTPQGGHPRNQSKFNST